MPKVSHPSQVTIEGLGNGAVTFRPTNVRGVVFANVADLAAFTVAGNDGLTYAEGELLLLANQTTGAECGVYRVGPVSGGTAKLSRVKGCSVGEAILNGQIIHASEGTIFAGSEWKAMCTGAKVWGTDDPLFYPRCVKATVTLAAGLKNLGSAEGLFLFSTTKSMVLATRNTANTSTATTGGYAAPVANRTAGKSGTGAVRIVAQAADGTTNTADISTVDVLVVNW